MRIPQYWRYIFLFITAGLFFLFQEIQPPLSYDFAPQFDGNDYADAYRYFNGTVGEHEVSFPFNSRVLVPWLAAKLGLNDMLSSFQWLNLLFSLLGVWMLFELWRSLGFELKWFFVGFGWLLLHWTGMIRLNALDPITVDLPLYCFQALFLWILFKRKFVWLLILAPLASIQKESFVAIMVLLTMYGGYHNHKRQDAYFDMKWIIAALALAITAHQLAAYFFPPIEAGRGAIITILYHAKEALLNPFELLRWIVAAFVAFGPILITGLFVAGRRRYYDNRRNMLMLFSGLYFLFGILAGGDMTRIIFLGFPFIMTWLMYELRDLENKRIWLLVVLALPLTFLIKTIPDPAFEWELWQSWYPEFAPVKTVLFFTGYMILCVLLYLWTQRKNKA